MFVADVVRNTGILRKRSEESANIFGRYLAYDVRWALAHSIFPQHSDVTLCKNVTFTHFVKPLFHSCRAQGFAEQSSLLFSRACLESGHRQATLG